MLDSTAYRGVIRYRDAAHAPERSMGEHTIDWTIRESPTVQIGFGSGRGVPAVQRWRRLRDLVSSPARQTTPSGTSASPPPGAGVPASGRRPALGELVRTDEMPELVRKVAPVYPSGLKRGEAGTVMVQALVLEDGTVGETQVVLSIPALDSAAVACVRQFKFLPARTKGLPVPVWVAVPVKFDPR